MLGALSALSAFAYDAHVGAGYYRLDKTNKTASLTYLVNYSTTNASAYVGDVVIPDTFEFDEVTYTVTSIDTRAFFSCTDLTSVELPATITTMGSNVFFNCTALKRVKLPDNLTTMDYSAFQNCSALEEIAFPSTLSSISTAAFSGCSSLRSVHFSPNIHTIQSNAFLDCVSLEKLELPDNLVTISPRAFWGCSGIKELRLPDSVRNVEMGAFQDCTGLKRVEFGQSIQVIDVNCFAGCSQLADVYCPVSQPPANIYSSAFNNIFASSRLHVPNESIEAYYKYDLWKKFTTILPLKCAMPTIQCDSQFLTIATATNLSYAAVSENYTYSIDVSDLCNEEVISDAEEKFCSLALTYDVRVKAMAEGCEESEELVAQLCWREAANVFDSEAGEIITAIDTSIDRRPVLVTSHNGVVTITGLSDGESVALYNLSGRRLALQTAVGSAARFSTASGQVVVVRVGDSYFKVRVN